MKSLLPLILISISNIIFTTTISNCQVINKCKKYFQIYLLLLCHYFLFSFYPFALKLIKEKICKISHAYDPIGILLTCYEIEQKQLCSKNLICKVADPCCSLHIVPYFPTVLSCLLPSLK